MAEPVEMMPSVGQTHVGQGNRVLDGVHMGVHDDYN